MMATQSFGNIDELISLAEIARRVKLSRRTVREHLLRDGVPAYVFGSTRNSAVRYRKRDIDQWLDRCRMRQKVLEEPGTLRKK